MCQMPVIYSIMIYRKTLQESENYTKFLKKSTLPWNSTDLKPSAIRLILYIMVYDIGNYPFTFYLSYIIILTYIILKSILFSNKFHLFIIYLFQLYQFSFRFLKGYYAIYAIKTINPIKSRIILMLILY